MNKIANCTIDKFNNDESNFKFEINKVNYFFKISRRDKIRKINNNYRKKNKKI